MAEGSGGGFSVGEEREKRGKRDEWAGHVGREKRR